MRLQRLVPPQPFLGVLLQRAAVLWLLGRLMIAFYAVILEGVGVLAETVCLGLPTGAALAGIVAGLNLLDVHRRHEVILLANLGSSRFEIFLLAFLPALALEAATCLIPL